MFSNSSKYALNAVLYLAQQSNSDVKVNVKRISESIAAPAPYVSKLLQDLTRHGIVSSTKGPKGGFYLTEENRKKTLLDIVELVEGEDRFDSCMLGFKQCNPNNPCVIHEEVAASKNNILNVLRSKNLNQLSADIQRGNFNFPIE